MSKLLWKNLEKPLSKPVLQVVRDVLKFEKMTPVQVSINQQSNFSIEHLTKIVEFNLRAQQFHFCCLVKM